MTVISRTKREILKMTAIRIPIIATVDDPPPFIVPPTETAERRRVVAKPIGRPGRGVVYDVRVT